MLPNLNVGNWCLHYATATGYQHLVSVLISFVWALFISRLLIEFRCCALADACLAEISRPSDTCFRSLDLESYSNRKHTAGALRKGIREILEYSDACGLRLSVSVLRANIHPSLGLANINIF